MDVKIGQRLPALVVGDEHGRHIGLEELRGGGPAVLFFMRAGNCMICMRHARTLANMRVELAAHNVLPIVVVPGKAADADAVRRKLGAPVRVVYSDTVTAHRAVGLGTSMLMQHSGTFLLDADGTLRHTRAAAMPTGTFDLGELLDALARL
ncbi:MAG: redoxin domain-containing protein [bacterium]